MTACSDSWPHHRIICKSRYGGACVYPVNQDLSLIRLCDTIMMFQYLVQFDFRVLVRPQTFSEQCDVTSLVDKE